MTHLLQKNSQQPWKQQAEIFKSAISKFHQQSVLD
jgi:hypothetical protein